MNEIPAPTPHAGRSAVSSPTPLLPLALTKFIVGFSPIYILATLAAQHA